MRLRALPILAAALACTPLAFGQSTLTNDAVVKMVKAGLGEDIILNTIKNSPGAYSLDADHLVSLKQAGVTNREISAMQAHDSGGAIVTDAPGQPDPGRSGPSAAAPEGSVVGDAGSGKAIPRGSKIYVAPMNGFETYLQAALDKKQVPVTVVEERDKADYEITGVADSQKATWSKVLMTGSTSSAEEASIKVTEIRSGAIVFAYAVNKSNSARGKQSAAEACAKHLREKIEAGR